MQKPKRRKGRVLDKTLNAIIKKITINADYDIPYTAGYNEAGDTIYIDRTLPHFMNLTRSKRKKINIIKFLVLHEIIEKTLIRELGDIHYKFAHKIATITEKAALRGEGVNVKAYDQFMTMNIKRISSKKVLNPPDDLDLKPYIDEKDSRVLKQIKRARGFKK